MKITLRALSKRVTLITSAFVLAVSSLLVAVPFIVSETVYAAGETVVISNPTDLKNAITNQADGQTWNIAAGDYGLMADFTHAGENKLFFPITANNITINGLGNPTIYGAEYTSNGSGGLQGSFINVLGDNISINGITVMSKVFVNKAIEVRGSNSSINNVVVTPNTKVDDSVFIASGYPDYSRNFAGSIYYYSGSAHTLSNTTIRNGGVSHWSSGETLTLNNTSLVYDASCIPTTWCDAIIYSYRVRDNGNTIIGTPKITYRVSSDRTNWTNAITNHRAGDTIELDSDIITNKQITLDKANVTFNGNGHTVDGAFQKTDNSNNSAIGVWANGVTVNNIRLTSSADLSWPQQLHGVNVYQATGVTLKDVTATDFEGAGLIVGKDSDVTVENITTANNGWYGINVDKTSSGTSATLTVKGVSTHNEDSTAHIWIDDRNVTGNTVNDPNAQYARYWEGNGYKYLLDRTKPTAELTVAPFNPSSFDIEATDDQRLTRIDYSLWTNGNSTQIGVWGHTVDWNDRNNFVKTFTQYCDHGGDHNDPCVAKNFTSDLDEGTYQLRATATDVMGKQTNAETREFVVDRTAPSVGVSAPTGTTNAGSVEVKGFANDGNLRYYACYITTNQPIHAFGKDWSTGQEPKSGASNDISLADSSCITYWTSGVGSDGDHVLLGNFDTSGLPDGAYTIHVHAHDKAGNSNEATTEFTIDRTAPNVTVNPIADSTNTTPTITGTVDADAVSVKVSLDEGATWNDAVIDGTTWTFAVTSPLAVRTHTVIAIATDAVGNTSSSDILTPQPYWTQFAVNEPPVVTVQQGAGTPVPGAVVVAPQDTTPDAEVETEDDADGNVSAAGESDSNNEASTLGEQDNQKSWSLVNALLTASIVLGSIMALVGVFGKKQDKDAKSKQVVGLITLVPAIGAAILFFAVEDLSAKMVWLNTWTILVTIIAVLQVALVAKARDNE